MPFVGWPQDLHPGAGRRVQGRSFKWTEIHRYRGRRLAFIRSVASLVAGRVTDVRFGVSVRPWSTRTCSEAAHNAQEPHWDAIDVMDIPPEEIERASGGRVWRLT